MLCSLPCCIKTDFLPLHMMMQHSPVHSSSLVNSLMQNHHHIIKMSSYTEYCDNCLFSALLFFPHSSEYLAIRQASCRTPFPQCISTETLFNSLDDESFQYHSSGERDAEVPCKRGQVIHKTMGPSSKRGGNK